MAPQFRVVLLPEDVENIVFGVFGVQLPNYDKTAELTQATRELHDLLTLNQEQASSPILVEPASSCGISPGLESTFMAYWTSPESYDNWSQLPETQQFWKHFLNNPASSTIGAYREVCTVHRTRLHHAGSCDYLSLGKQFTEVDANPQGWGSFRRRLEASATERFKSPLSGLPKKEIMTTHGRALTVTVPQNIFLLRETQVFDLCSTDDMQRWDDVVAPALAGWLDRIEGDPAETGCLSLRRLREHRARPDNGTSTQVPFSRTTQLAYFLSLEHAEKSARQEPTHKAMRAAYAKLQGLDAEFPAQLWAAVYILDHHGFDSLYVNCHPATGMLKWFNAEDVGSNEMCPAHR